MANAQTFPPTGIKPVLTSVHVSPSFVDRNTPPAADAKTSPCELNVTALASNALNPLFCSVHESPLSVDRNMPPPCPMIERVAAKMWPLYLLIPRPAISVDVRPVLASVQLSPLSVER